MPNILQKNTVITVLSQNAPPSPWHRRSENEKWLFGLNFISWEGYLEIPQYLNIHHKYVSSFYEVFEIAPQMNIIS